MLIPLVVLGLYYNLWSIQTANTDMIFQDQFLSFILLLFLIFLGFCINKDLKMYKVSKSFKSFVPSAIGLLILLSFGITALILSLKYNSPVDI